MRFMSRGIWGLFLGLATFGIFALAVSEYVRVQNAEDDAGPGRPGGAAERLLSANVQQIEPTAASPVLETFGEVTAARVLQLRSPESGKIIMLDPDFQSGAQIAAGTLLAEVDPAPFTASRDLAQSDLESAQADVEDAGRSVALAEEELTAAREQVELRQAALDRQISLKDRGVGTDAALEAAELSLSSAEQGVLSKEQALANARTSLTRANATVSRAKISLSEAERKLSNTKIYAGFDGVLGDALISEGVIVSPNERIGSLIDPSALEVSILLSLEQFASMIARVDDLSDLKVTVGLTANGPGFEAQITRTDATVQEGQTGRRIYARLSDRAAAILKSGDFAYVRIEEPEIDGVAWVPAGAVNSNNQVLLLGKGDILQEQDLRVITQADDLVMIAARPLAGQFIVSERTPQLGEGVKVRPLTGGQPLTPPEPVKLTPEQQAQFTERLNNNSRMPEAVKERLIGQVQSGEVSQETFDRLSRGGGRG